MLIIVRIVVIARLGFLVEFEDSFEELLKMYFGFLDQAILAQITISFFLRNNFVAKEVKK